MAQLIGKCLILGGMSALGLFLSYGLRARAACLGEFLCSLECMERELAFALPPIDALLARLNREAGKTSSGFFSRCQERFQNREEERFEEIWAACMEEEKLPLEQEDIQLLREVGGVIGRYDSDSQRLGLRRIHDRVETQIQQAREEANRMGKVYATLGISLGLFLIILL